MAKGVGFTLRELARALHASLEGDAAAFVTGVAPLESAGPDQISFLVDLRYAEAAKASRAGALGPFCRSYSRITSSVRSASAAA